MAKAKAQVSGTAGNPSFEELGPMGIEAIEQPAAALLEVRERIKDTKKEEKEKNDLLVEAMKAANKDYYKRDQIEVIIPADKPKRATVKHVASNGDGAGGDGAGGDSEE